MGYEIIKKGEGFDEIVLSGSRENEVFRKQAFRFHHVFDQDTKQLEIFETVAKPVIKSVYEGFNGTIFAYGQTGSGKTYSITGSPKNYQDRGIIPRSIQYIFAKNNKVCSEGMLKPTIYISYMEIYNEIGYDLLGAKHNKSTNHSLEELPRIVLLEDKKGEANIRNLSVLPVSTEQEAMRLLFLGDTNRTIAETPLNDYSSRSHCIFTIYITSGNASSSKIRSSKLHLVDLAGSERVYKTLTDGLALNEAKYINLSLHFLQQVIRALTEEKRQHIPYRNSMMTLILKDSLSGNCMTSMLATLGLSKSNIMESISTCKFAQRVSLIKTEPIINELTDPQAEILFLKSKIRSLEAKLSASLANNSRDSKPSKDSKASSDFKRNVEESAEPCSMLSKHQEDQCKSFIKDYLESSTSKKMVIDFNLPKIEFCFNLLKQELSQHKRNSAIFESERDKHHTEVIALKNILEQKEQELARLKNLIDRIPENCVSWKKSSKKSVEIQEPPKNEIKKDPPTENSCSPPLKADETILYETFLIESNIKEDLDDYKYNLEKKLEQAKMYAAAIDQSQRNINFIRQKLEVVRSHCKKSQLVHELDVEQRNYRQCLDEMNHLKSETFHLENGLKQMETQAMLKFQQWKKDRDKMEKMDWRHNYQNTNTNNPVQCNGYIPGELVNQITNYENFDRSCNAIKRCTNKKCICYLRKQNKEISGYPNITRCCGCTTHSQDFVLDTIWLNDSRNNYHNCRNDVYLYDADMRQCNQHMSNVANHLIPDYPKTTSHVNDLASISESEIPIKDQSCGGQSCSYNYPEVNFPNNPQYCYATTELNNYEPIANYQENLVDVPQCQGLVEVERCQNQEPQINKYFQVTDSPQFQEFMKTISLTGDHEIDNEIFEFYRSKFT